MKRAITSALSIALLGVVLVAPAAQAAGGTLYVDGKTGDDDNSGSSSSPLKTIAEGASRVPTGTAAAGWTVVVKGYTDYIYRERPIPPGWGRRGTASARVTFQAAGYATGSTARYVRPIVSGADLAPRPGETWEASGTAGVWKTPFQTEPFLYGSYSGSIKTAVFQDVTTWLWEQTSLSALAERAKSKLGGYYWKDGWLYVSGKGTTDPSGFKIDVITRNSFLFIGTNGVSAVAVRGFEVRHSANGVALTKGVDDSVVADNVLVGNLLMGVATSGGQTSGGADPAKRNIVARNRISYSTFQAIKIDEGSQDSTYCDNVINDNGLQGIKVQGPPGNTSYTGTTSGITICRNTLSDHDFNPTNSIYNNAAGISVANGARSVTIEDNTITRNDVGIHITQEASGQPAMSGIVMRKNRVSGNRRFGINFYDGAYSSTGGSGSMRSEYDVIWGNGIGIMVSRASTNKTILHATVHGNTAEGIKIGEASKTAASVTISESLVTSNKGYGVWLVTGHNASLRYTGLSGNSLGSIKGSPTKTAVNSERVGYISTSTSSGDFLRIPFSSYQFTAGPSRSPIGARY